MYELMSTRDLKFNFNLEDEAYFGTSCQVAIECEGLEQFGKHVLRSPE